MTKFWGVGIISVVILSAFGMYSLKLNTTRADKRVEQLRIELVKRQEEIKMLRAEWAFLNNPDRLEALVAEYLSQDLQMTEPGQIAELANVPLRPVGESDEGDQLGPELEYEVEELERLLSDSFSRGGNSDG